MPPILISIGKWLVTAVIVPLAEKWVVAYLKAQAKLKEYYKKKEVNDQSAENYANKPTADTFHELP